MNFPKSMTRQTGGLALGETSTRSNSASRAICMAWRIGTTPTFPPSAPINRTSETRMPSFTRNSEALISFSYFKTVDQHSAGFWRTNNTTRGGESSIKQTVNDQNSSVAHGLDTFYNSGAFLATLFSPNLLEQDGIYIVDHNGRTASPSTTQARRC